MLETFSDLLRIDEAEELANGAPCTEPPPATCRGISLPNAHMRDISRLASGRIPPPGQYRRSPVAGMKDHEQK